MLAEVKIRKHNFLLYGSCQFFQIDEMDIFTGYLTAAAYGVIVLRFYFWTGKYKSRGYLGLGEKKIFQISLGGLGIALNLRPLVQGHVLVVQVFHLLPGTFLHITADFIAHRTI